MSDDRPSVEPARVAIVAVALCALLIRVAFAVASAESLNADPDAYRQIAENLRQYAVYGPGSAPTAFRPPLYPVLLAALTINGQVTPAIVGGLHVLFGVATVVLTFLLGYHWRLGRWACAAAALVAIDPILLNQSTQVMTETLATLLATAALYALSLWDAKPSLRLAIVAGIVFGLASLCRPTFLPWLGLSAVGMVWLRCDAWKLSSLRASVMPAIACILSAAIVISPWVLRNYFVFGVPKVTTTHGGYTVLLGNNPSFYRYLREAPRGTTWDSSELASMWELRHYSASPNELVWTLPHEVNTPPVQRSEFEDDEFAYSLARRYIADEPGMFVYSCIVRVDRLWQLVPYKTSRSESTLRLLSRILIGCWYSLVFLLAIVALVHLRAAAFRSPVIWGLLLCVTFTTVHALYWSNMRMRAPLMPFVCLLAAHGAARIANRPVDRKP
jgi:4-amino-4-deoxy-L-arabinose transferase-like glycosyltransferase